MVVMIVLLLFLVSAPVQAQSEPWANKLFDGKVTHDHGVVARGANLLHSFSFKNVYAVPLEITQIRLSCGCAEAKASKKILQPGEVGTIDVTMDGRRFTGEKTVSVFVTVGPNFISTAELKVTATNRADIVFNPGQVEFGNVVPGQSLTKLIDVEYAGKLDWRINEVITKGTPFKVELKETYRRPGAQVGYQLKVSLSEDVPPGLVRKSIVLRTNDGNSPLLPVLVEANVQESLRVIPKKLNLGTVAKGAKKSQRVIVQGKEPFRIIKVDGAGDGVSVGSIQPSEDQKLHVLTFEIELGRLGEVDRDLQIRTDGQPTPLVVHLNATVVEP